MAGRGPYAGVTFTDILYEKRDQIARITINRPQVLNAFTNHTMREICLALQDAHEDDGVGVVVLTGAGERAFSAGGDVKWEGEGGERAMYDLFPDYHNAIRCCLKPVIARVNGYSIGGGHHMHYACDLTIAAEHAIFGQNGPRVGSPADGFYVNRLCRIVGHKRAREMWYLCRRYTARQMLEWGLINAVVPMDQLDAEVDKWCNEILDMSPTCLKVLKASFERELDDIRDLPFSIQRLVAPYHMDGPEQQEGTQAFQEKRRPDFRKFRVSR
ncbi:MAG: enoyl-CoA hydratase/isomerase family protein [Chloroflexi bacterium]|nr:enoyl-CoA hydratase/isomerase family protein [Chloroflexota bacterium]